MNKTLLVLLETYLNKNKIIDTSIIELKVPKQKEFGDSTTNLALKISKQLGKSSMVIAKEISKFLEKDNLIKRADVVKPGFINIYINEEDKFNVINEILKLKSKYGISDKNKGKKANIEFVSANPTGHLHIGHARNAILGDVIANVWEYTGYKVTREYWINDYGNQMKVLANSIYQFYLREFDSKHSIPEETDYKGLDIQMAAKELSKEFKDKFFNKKFEDVAEEIAEWGGNFFLKEIKKILKDIGIKKFDIWQSEKQMFESGKVDRALDKLKNIKGALYEKDGATWLATTKNSKDDKDRVIKKADGNQTYIVGDIANHVEKYDKGFDLIVNLWGADHAGYDERVRSSVTWLGYDANILKIGFMQMIRLVKNGEKFKMSKRKGTVITIRELLEKFGRNKLRYFIASKQLQSHFDLDISLLEDDTNNSLLNYSMYSYVRALKLVKENSKKYNILENHKFTKLESDFESDLVKSLSKMKSTVERASDNREPQILIVYINELSQLFHSFYGNIRIKGSENDVANERLTLAKSFIQVMENLYKLVGIEPLEKM